jgi:sortase A
MKKYLVVLGGVCCIIGAIQLISNVSIPIKAYLSVKLINHAWAQTKDYDYDVKPWPWIDTVPMAKLYFPDFNTEYVVMKGVSGSVLAFTPGWHEQTSLPGEEGVSLIAAHRDTHFSILRKMKPGDRLSLETKKGNIKEYIVSELLITDENQVNVPLIKNKSVLLLSTCYPFENWSAEKDMRIVLVAKEIMPENV